MEVRIKTDELATVELEITTAENEKKAATSSLHKAQDKVKEACKSQIISPPPFFSKWCQT